MEIMGIDPGDHMGYTFATFNEDKTLTVQSTGIVETYALGMTFIQNVIMGADLDVMVVEDYIINPKVYGHDHQGDRGSTLRQIGALELVCGLGLIEMVKQMPTVKPPGYGFLGKKYSRGKTGQHAWDSMAHLAYYLVTKKGMQPLA